MLASEEEDEDDRPVAEGVADMRRMEGIIPDGGWPA